MQYPPCVNKSCKSYGQSHPNCNCWGGTGKEFAEGGTVSQYCEGEHKPDCEHYAEGGTVIPDSEVEIDIPDNEVKIDAASGEIPDSEVIVDGSEASSLGQKVITGLEGIAEGIAGPIPNIINMAFLGEEDLKKTNAALNARREANPITHGVSEVGGLIASTFIPGTQGWAAARATAKANEILRLGKIGQASLAAGVEMFVKDLGDETTKALLGKGDPEEPFSAAIAHAGFAAIMGSVTGGVFNVLGSKAGNQLQKIDAEKWARRAKEFIQGAGFAVEAPAAMKVLEKTDLPTSAAFRNGYDAIAKGTNKLVSKVTGSVASGAATTAAGAVGSVVGGPLGGTMGTAMGTAAGKKVYDYVSKKIEDTIGQRITSAGKGATAIAMRALGAGDGQGVYAAIKYATDVNRGTRMIENGIGDLFKYGGQSFLSSDSPTDYTRKKIKDFIEGGGVDQQIQNQVHAENSPEVPAFAKGGTVKASPNDSAKITKEDSFGEAFPEQNLLLNTARGRVSGYLNSLRPLPNAPRLPFDREKKDRAKEKTYNEAIDIAAAPLSILGKIKNGSIKPEHIQHLNSLYPELYGNLKSRMTKKIMEAQLSGEKPSYRVRQSMSLFLQAPLDSTFLPQNIQAAQQVFAQKKGTQQQQMQTATKKRGSASLSKSAQDNYTGSQAREQRLSQPATK